MSGFRATASLAALLCWLLTACATVHAPASPEETLALNYKTIETLFGFSKPVELNDIMAIYAGCRKLDDYENG